MGECSLVFMDSEFKQIARRFFELGVECGRSEAAHQEFTMSPLTSESGEVVSLEAWRNQRGEVRRDA